MTVYIVVETDYEWWQIKGVFATKAKALRFMEYGEGFDKRNYSYQLIEEPVEGWEDLA